jgi:hypothetical protein
MKISYAITVCNEFLEIQKLIPFLLENKRIKDEIVILFDQKNGDPELLNYLLKFNKLPKVQTWRGYFDGNFSDWKNKLTEYCSGDYIFQIDADELPNKELIDTLPFLLKMNRDVDVMLVPRVNIVEGLTQDHIAKWRWSVNEKEWVNWPDYQWRVYKNNSSIKWVNKVHERLDGFKQYATLPMEEGFALYHPKDIKRQEKQNEYYETL